MERSVLDRFIRGEISPAGTIDKDIPLFTAGATIHLYAIAVAVDPKFLVAIQHEYSAVLLAVFFFLALAERGVIIEISTARSHTQDGIKLMRKLGLPWLVSPVSGWELFSVRVAESGLHKTS